MGPLVEMRREEVSSQFPVCGKAAFKRRDSMKGTCLHNATEGTPSADALRPNANRPLRNGDLTTSITTDDSGYVQI